MKMKYTVASSLLMALAFTGCQNSDDVISSEFLNLEPEYVKFAADQQINSLENATRTAYAGKDADGYVINWSANDQISIFCPEAEGNKSHTYKIKTHGSKSSDLQATSTEALKWNQARSNHNFYAVYPGGSDKATFSTDGDVVTLSLNTNVNKQLTNNAGSDYTIEPSMEYAYMVANASSTPRNTTVNLDFKPIMTTYEVTITNTSTENIALNGFVVKMDNSEGYIKDGKFQYDVNTGQLVKFSGGTNNVAYVNLFLKDQNWQNNITLGAKKKIKFTLFLPPITVSSEKPIQMYVNANYEYSKSFEVETTIPSSKTAINVNLQKGGSGWLGLLDDDIYASQLSLPGASWAGCNTALSSTGTFSGYAIQSMDINALWENGVRVFDIHGDANLKAFNYTSYSTTANSLFTTLSSLLNNPKYSKEFAIIIIRQETGNSTSSQWNNLYNAYWASDKSVTFKSDMTLGDLRKKIMIIALDWGYNNIPKFSANFATNQWPSQWQLRYADANWYTNRELKEATIVSKDNVSSKVWVSDYVDMRSDDAYLAKLGLIHNQLNKAKSMDVNTWSIMQYASTLGASWSGWNSNAFASATGDMTSVYNRYYVGGQSKNGNALLNGSIYDGPSGIILIPFIGLRYTSSGTGGQYSPNCDKFASYQIQRNFVNDLKRKP